MKTNKLLDYLQYLGIKPSMESFTDRKKMQKISYLFPLFGLNAGLTTDMFNWYLHGPYSPVLTRTLFDLLEKPQVHKSELSQADRKRLDKLKRFLGEDIESIDSLELLVSLHFLLHKAEEYNEPVDVVIKVLKDKKPYFKYSEIKRALRKLQTLS